MQNRSITTREFIAETTLVRRFRASSAAVPPESERLQIPVVFPTEPPGWNIALSSLQFCAEVASAALIASIVSGSSTESKTKLMGQLLPATMVAAEYLVIPLLKFSPQLHSKVMSMRAFQANDSHAEAAFTHASRRWLLNDAGVFVMVVGFFYLKRDCS